MGLGIVLLVIGFLLANIHFAQAQQAAKIPRIGFLTGAALSTQFARMDAFREGLRDLGYVEGKNIVIDWRSYEGKRDRQRVLVGELVDLKADVIVAVGVGDIRAVKDATTTIPIVMLVGGDPVASGFVSSLARPGGNITGLATLRPELTGKRLELMKEIVPKLSRVAIFASPESQDYSHVLKELDVSAEAFAVKLQVVDVRSPKDIEPFSECRGRRPVFSDRRLHHSP